jgi:hypothetical protein
MMQSIDEHQEIPKDEAAVMPVGEPRKRSRVCNLAAERGQKRKERTWGNRGSRRKSAAACRKVSRRAKVAWRKRNLFRNVQTQRNCGPRKRLTVTGIRMTRCAKVARHKKRNHEGPSVEQGRRKNKTRNKTARGTRIGRTLGRSQLMCQEGTNGTRNRDVKEQLRLANERTTRGIYRKSTRLEIAKRIASYTVGLKRIKDWTLWMGRAPLKQKKKKRRLEEESVM